MSIEMTRFDFKEHLLLVMDESEAEKAAFVAQQIGLVDRDSCTLCGQGSMEPAGESAEPLRKFWSEAGRSFYLAHEGCKDSVEMGWGEEVEPE